LILFVIIIRRFSCINSNNVIKSLWDYYHWSS